MRLKNDEIAPSLLVVIEAKLIPSVVTNFLKSHLMFVPLLSLFCFYEN